MSLLKAYKLISFLALHRELWELISSSADTSNQISVFIFKNGPEVKQKQ